MGRDSSQPIPQLLHSFGPLAARSPNGVGRVARRMRLATKIPQNPQSGLTPTVGRLRPDGLTLATTRRAHNVPRLTATLLQKPHTQPLRL